MRFDIFKYRKFTTILCLAFFLASLVFCVRSLQTVWADFSNGDGVIKGLVVNGTFEGGTTVGLSATLHQYGSNIDKVLTTITDESGRFQFNGIVFQADTIYRVYVTYKGVLYSLDVNILENVDSYTGELIVYEPTTDSSVISVSSASIVFAKIEKSSQIIWVLELVKIVNSTDRTYAPGPDPMKLLGFGLPPGYQLQNVDTDLTTFDVLQVDKGFRLTASVPPGEHVVTYDYIFPYIGENFLFKKSFPYGANKVRMIVPDHIEASVNQVEPVTEYGSPYQLLTLTDLKRDSDVSLSLQKLPQSSFVDRLMLRVEGFRFEYIAPMVLVFMMLCAICLVIWNRSILASN